MRFDLALVAVSLTVAGASATINFRKQEIESDFGIGYAVATADVNGDGKLDIAAINETQVVWWENPSWKKHIVLNGKTEADNVCFAPADIDGDGRVDFALGAAWRPSDTKTGGTIQWINRRSDATSEWALHPLGFEPTTHRMRWADTNADGRQELIIAPLHGRDIKGPKYWDGNGVRLLALTPSSKPDGEKWAEEVVDDSFHIVHNFWVLNFDDDPADELLVASYEGVHLLDRESESSWKRINLGEGFVGDNIRGAGEIKLGKLSDGKRYIATVEPWHANHIVIYGEPSNPTSTWKRQIVASRLGQGHALWTGDLDADGDEELAFGWRGKGSMPYDLPGVAVYDPTDERIQFLDWGGMATEDITIADLNGDGRPDVIASGRATHNVRIYWNDGVRKPIE